MEMKLNEPISVYDEDSLAAAVDKLESEKSLYTVKYMTKEFPSNKLIDVNKIVNDIELYYLEIKPYDIGFEYNHGVTTRYYSITVSSTKEQLEKLEDIIEKIKDDQAKFDKNSTLAEGIKHTQRLESTASKPLH